jgi:superfamily I DNA/RNA helicase
MAYNPVGEQITIINGDESALVLGGPGKGKTATALAAASRWLDRNPQGRALFTSFSNAAVQRLASSSGIGGKRVEFRTFHSVALEVLKDYGRFVGLRRPAVALDAMEQRLVAAESGWDATDEEAALEAYARDTGKVAFALSPPA